MENRTITQEIERGDTALGIELGSTRIKAVLIGPDHTPLAAGSHDWENENLDGVWTYSLDAVWAGIQAAYRDLAGQARQFPQRQRILPRKRHARVDREVELAADTLCQLEIGAEADGDLELGIALRRHFERDQVA